MRWGERGVSYRPIPSRPGYFAGDDGSVWSLLNGKIVKRKPYLAGKTGRRAYICFAPNDGVSLPLLILEAFIGPRPDGMQCCHDNGHSLDNRLCNLRWDTPESNTLDRFRHAHYTKPAEIQTYLALKGSGDWMTNGEIAAAVGIAVRSARRYTERLARAGALDVVRPPHPRPPRFRLRASGADIQRLEDARVALGL